MSRLNEPHATLFFGGGHGVRVAIAARIGGTNAILRAGCLIASAGHWLVASVWVAARRLVTLTQLAHAGLDAIGAA